MTMSIEQEELIEKIFVDGKIVIEDLNFSTRVYNQLKRAEIHNVETLLESSINELYNIRNFGPRSREEVGDVIVALGIPALHLGMTDDEINSLLSEEQKIKREERIREEERIKEEKRIKEEEAKKIREEKIREKERIKEEKRREEERIKEEEILKEAKKIFIEKMAIKDAGLPADCVKRLEELGIDSVEQLLKLRKKEYYSYDWSYFESRDAEIRAKEVEIEEKKGRLTIDNELQFICGQLYGPLDAFDALDAEFDNLDAEFDNFKNKQSFYRKGYKYDTLKSILCYYFPHVSKMNISELEKLKRLVMSEEDILKEEQEKQKLKRKQEQDEQAIKEEQRRNSGLRNIFICHLPIKDLDISNMDFNYYSKQGEETLNTWIKQLIRAGVETVEQLLKMSEHQCEKKLGITNSEVKFLTSFIQRYFGNFDLCVGLTNSEIERLKFSVMTKEEIEQEQEEKEEMEQMKILELKNKMLTEKNKEMQENNRRKQEKLEKLRKLLEEKGRLEEESRRLDEEINEFLNCLEKENEVVNNEKGKN